MKSIKLVIALGLVLASLLTIYILYAATKARSSISNGFLREFRSDIVEPYKEINLRFNTYYIGGASDEYLFLANYLTPNHLLKIRNNVDTQSITLSLPQFTNRNWKLLRTFINPPFIQLIEGRSPSIYGGYLADLKINKMKLDKNSKFLISLPISSKSAIVNIYDSSQKQHNLAKISLDSPNLIVQYSKLLVIQKDDLFKNTGKILYNQSKDKLIYLYRYSNKFIRFDTSLNLIYASHTIDTNKSVKLNLASYGGSKKIASPPVTVNKTGCMDNENLLICSGLRADNEKIEEFQKYLPIDIYSLKNGTYKYSFYIPRYNKGLINDMQICNNILYIIMDKYLYAYRLKLK